MSLAVTSPPGVSRRRMTALTAGSFAARSRRSKTRATTLFSRARKLVSRVDEIVPSMSIIRTLSLAGPGRRTTSRSLSSPSRSSRICGEQAETARAAARDTPRTAVFAVMGTSSVGSFREVLAGAPGGGDDHADGPRQDPALDPVPLVDDLAVELDRQGPAVDDDPFGLEVAQTALIDPEVDEGEDDRVLERPHLEQRDVEVAVVDDGPGRDVPAVAEIVRLGHEAIEEARGDGLLLERARSVVTVVELDRLLVERRREDAPAGQDV